jgi:hypothetical protein
MVVLEIFWIRGGERREIWSHDEIDCAHKGANLNIQRDSQALSQYIVLHTKETAK